MIHQARLRFLINAMQKEVMVRCRLTFMQVLANFVRTVLVVDTLMRQEELAFSASDLLNVYTMGHLKELGTNLLNDSHYLRLRNPCQPQMRLVTKIPNKDMYLDEFVWILGNWKF